MLEQNIHGVTKIEVTEIASLTIDNSFNDRFCTRKIRVYTDKGEVLNLNLYGNTATELSLVL